MWQEILKAIPVYFSCMFKFIFGPVGGYTIGLNLITTIITTLAGMMTAVIIFTYFGEYLRNKVFVRFSKPRKRFTERSRRTVSLWRKYGMIGVAALTPVILTPIGGTLIAVSFGTPKNKLLLYMLISGAFWSLLLTMATYFLGDSYLKPFLQFVY